MPKVKIKAWGRALGHYNVPTAISLDINICDNKLKKYFLEFILLAIGADGSECPPKRV